jgi:hypothetical protein
MEHRQLVVPRGRRDPSSHPANEEDDQRGKVPQVADTQRIATSHAITKYADDKASRSQPEVQIAPTTTRHADLAVRKPPGLVAQATTMRMTTNDREATMTRRWKGDNDDRPPRTQRRGTGPGRPDMET